MVLVGTKNMEVLENMDMGMVMGLGMVMGMVMAETMDTMKRNLKKKKLGLTKYSVENEGRKNLIE